MMLCYMCQADREINPCQYFPNNTYIRDPDDCSRGLTCIDFMPVERTVCTGTKAFYDKDKDACAASLSDQSLCDISCVNETGRFVPDPKSCYGYFYCQDEDWARYGHCPELYHFDYASQQCIYDDTSDCKIKELNFCAIVKDSVNFNDPSSCEKYFTCKKGAISSATCKDTYFDDVTGTCVKKSMVQCDAHPLPSDVCGTAKKPKADVFVSDGATCRGAFYCSVVADGFDTNPSWTQCKENTFFSEDAQACVSPLTVACSEDRCDGRNLPFVSSGTKGCRHYLRCADGVTVEELSCGNKFFDEEAQVCTSSIIQYPSCS